MPAFAHKRPTPRRPVRPRRARSSANSRRFSDSSGRPAGPGMFLTRAEAVPVERAVDGQDAVKVVDFMLQQFGKGAIRLYEPDLAFRTEVAHAHAPAALQIHQQARE